MPSARAGTRRAPSRCSAAGGSDVAGETDAGTSRTSGVGSGESSTPAGTGDTTSAADASSGNDTTVTGGETGRDTEAEPGGDDPLDLTACRTWAEGLDDEDDGATRDFYNRAAGLPWRLEDLIKPSKSSAVVPIVSPPPAPALGVPDFQH